VPTTFWTRNCTATRSSGSEILAFEALVEDYAS
jgi:hypothetical protein